MIPLQHKTLGPASVLAGVLFVQAAIAAPSPPPVPPPPTGNPVYLQDTRLKTFTDSVVNGNYATFIDGLLACTSCSSHTLPYTPTTAILSAPDYPRVIGRDANPPIIVEFGSAIANIAVFNNIDHIGYGWDAYQYNVYGSNDGINFTLLFDPVTKNEADAPNTGVPFTLATWYGTAPTLVNNTLTPGMGSVEGVIGYEEYFSFANAYRYYGFRTSTLALNESFEIEQELSAVAQAVAPLPEPGSLWLLGAGLAGLCGVRMRHPSRTSARPAAAGHQA